MKKLLKKIFAMALTSSMVVGSMAVSVYATNIQKSVDTDFERVDNSILDANPILLDENGDEIKYNIIDEDSINVVLEKDIEKAFANQSINQFAYPESLVSYPLCADSAGELYTYSPGQTVIGTGKQQMIFSTVSPSKMTSIRNTIEAKGYSFVGWLSEVNYVVEASVPDAMVLKINDGEYQRFPIYLSGSYTLKNIVTPNPEDITEVYKTKVYGHCEFTYPSGKPGTSIFSASLTYNQ